MKKKSLKGMTLMEIIIAMTVMVICGTILALACMSVVTNTRVARHVTTKVNEQATVVENRDPSITAYHEADQLNFQIHGGGASANIGVDKYEAPTTQSPDEENSGNLRYFRPTPVTTS
jgi:prepilin-type N-terminal cleavage/methylation domain-containing protein